MNATLERATAIDAVRWTVVLMAAVAAWECARSLNAMVHTLGLTQTDTVVSSFREIWNRPPSAPGLVEHLKARAPVAASVVFFASMAALAARLCLSTTLLGALYGPSAARERRGMSGFLAASFGLFAQAALIFAMTSFALPGQGPHDVRLVPVLMAFFLAGNAVWFVLLLAMRRPEDKPALRGLPLAFASSLAAAAGLAVCLALAKASVSESEAPQAGFHLAAAAAPALLLCVLDLAFQSAVYRSRPGKLGAILAALVSLAALAAAGGAVWLNA